MTTDTATLLSVPAFEAGAVRVFSLDAAEPRLAAIFPPHPIDAGHLAPLLGLDTLRDEDAERIAIADLGDYTLSEFLRIGHDIRSADLAPHAQALDALKGHVLLIHSTAFAGAPVQLSPAQGLRPIALLHRNDAPPAPLSLPENERPEILTPPPQETTKSRRSPWAVLIFSIVILIVLIERLLR